MNALEQRYLAYFDEMNVLAQQIDVETGTVDAAQKKVEDILEEAYMLGFFDAGWELDDTPERIAKSEKMSKWGDHHKRKRADNRRRQEASVFFADVSCYRGVSYGCYAMRTAPDGGRPCVGHRGSVIRRPA